MDSYGIHEAQLQGNASTLSNDKYNTSVRNHNAAALQQFNTKKAGVKGAGDQMKEMDGGLTAWHTLSGIHNAVQGYNQYKMYGGFRNAITTGAQHNIYQMSGGRAGSAPMGPVEKSVRAQTEGAGLGGPKVPVKYTGGMADDAAAVQNIQNLQGMVRDPARPNVFKQPVEQLQEGVLGPRTAQQTMEAPGMDRASKVAAAQGQDRAMGYTGPTTDATKTTGQLATEAKAAPLQKGTAGLSLEGEGIKGVMSKLGGAKGEMIGHAMGMAAPVLGGIASIAEDTTDMAEHWKTDNTAQKVSDIAGDVGGALDIAAVAAPVLAPLAGIADVVSGVASLVGGVKKEGQKLASATKSYATNQVASKGAMQSNQSSTTTTMGPSSTQKVAQAGSSSY